MQVIYSVLCLLAYFVRPQHTSQGKSLVLNTVFKSLSKLSGVQGLIAAYIARKADLRDLHANKNMQISLTNFRVGSNADDRFRQLKMRITSRDYTKVVIAVT